MRIAVDSADAGMELKRKFLKAAATHASCAPHPAAGSLVDWAIILDYILTPLPCVIIAAVNGHQLLPAVRYFVRVLVTGGFLRNLHV